jgi:hypothetical protein
MQKAEQSYTFTRAVDLKALAQIRSEQGPVYSLYLDLRPELGSGKTPLERFEQLLLEKKEQKKLDQGAPEDKERWEREANRIRQWLSSASLSHGSGLAILSGHSVDLWEVFILPFPVIDRLAVRGRPFVRPLEILLGEIKGTLVVLLNENQAQILEVFLGSVSEVARMQPGSLAASPAAGDRTGGFTGAVAERINSLWQEHSYDMLVIGGSEVAVTALSAALPESIMVSYAGEVQVSPDAPHADIAAGVQRVSAEFERRRETQRVEELISAANRNQGEAVLGLQQTLLSVRSKNKVRLLVVEQDFRQAGGECPNCGFLTEDTGHDSCLLCGMGLRPEIDVVGLALKRVLDQGGEVEVLRSPEARGGLEQHGQIGVMLNEAALQPQVKDISNRVVVSSDGEIDQDALHDQAMEESFPASDPPSW